MKKCFSATALAAFSCAIINASAILPDAKTIQKFPMAETEELIYANGFESTDKPVSLGDGFKLAPGEGNNGNTGLRVSRVSPPDKTQWAVLEMPPERFKEGERYMLKFHYRTKDLKCTRERPSHFVLAGIGFKPLKGEAGIPSRVEVIDCPDNTDFKEYELEFTVPPNARPRVTLQLRHYYTGTIWFDDVRVFKCGLAATLLLSEPRQHTFTTDNGKFRIRLECSQTDNIAAAIILNDPNGNIIRQMTVPLKDGDFSGDLGPDLPAGNAVLNVYAADLGSKTLLKHSIFNVNIKQANSKPPANAALLDKHGRLIVNDKPFMPIGAFFAVPSTEDREPAYREIEQAGFNCVMDYGSLWLCVDKKQPVGTNRILAGLDVLHKYNLKILFSLQQVTLDLPGRPETFDGLSSGASILEAVVNGVQKHPALLAWYMNDETPENQLPQLINARETINRLDPYHPTIALTNLNSALPNYARSGDIFSPDSYPLHKEKDGDNIGILVPFAEAVNRAGVPMWATLQAFNWGSFFKARDNSVDYREYIEPNGEQIRSMAYLYAIHGAKGFLFYDYPSFARYGRKYAEFGYTDWHERTLKHQTEAVSALKQAEPFIMSTEPSPELTVKNSGKAQVMSKAFRTADGRVGVLVVSLGGAPAEAEITIPGVPDLRSQFQRTENLGGGRYRFTASGLSSDLLLN